MTSKFVDVTNSHGGKQTIPAEWLDHPVLGAPFTPIAAPTGPAPEPTAGVPDESWTVAQLEAFADSRDIDLADARLKAEKLDAVLTAIGG